MAMSSPMFRRALKAIFAPGADADALLGPYEDYEIRSRLDGEALTEAAVALAGRPDLLPTGGLTRRQKMERMMREVFGAAGREEALEGMLAGLEQMPDGDAPVAAEGGHVHRVLGMFRKVLDEEAGSSVEERGIPAAVRIHHQLRERGADADALAVLGVLVALPSEAGTDCIIGALRDGLLSGSTSWTDVLHLFAHPEHPQTGRLFEAFRDGPPAGFAGVALLDVANEALLEGRELTHPFDNQAGEQRLNELLSDAEHPSHGVSAAVSLAFLSGERRGRLWARVQAHPSRQARTEGAWGLARGGDPRGLAALVELAGEVHTSARAAHYLAELGREELIPTVAKEPEFVAMAEMSEWLQHPSEYGAVPDELVLVDSRELFWPPTGDRRRLSILRWRYTEGWEEPNVAVGLAGSMTFELREETSPDMRPEEVYALHCCFELQQRQHEQAPEERTVEAGLAALAAVNPGFADYSATPP